MLLLDEDECRSPADQDLLDQVTRDLAYDLRVLWHCWHTDSRPPLDLISRLQKRFPDER
jgi:hypothetical protein